MLRKTVIFSTTLLMLLASLACSWVTFGATPTPEPDPCCLSTPSGPLKFEPESLPAGKAGFKYEAEIRITQNSTPVGDISILKGALPPGLEIVKVEGEDRATIRGLPETAGTFSFTVSVWCYGTMVSGQTGEKEYELVVEP